MAVLTGRETQGRPHPRNFQSIFFRYHFELSKISPKMCTESLNFFTMKIYFNIFLGCQALACSSCLINFPKFETFYYTSIKRGFETPF